MTNKPAGARANRLMVSSKRNHEIPKCRYAEKLRQRKYTIFRYC